MTRLILHIGDHKTGTSSLQRALAGGVAAAHALYPTAGRAQGAGHHNLAWAVGDDHRYDPASGGWADIAQEIRAGNPDTVIISSEAFEFKDPALLLPLIRAELGDAITKLDAVVYFRPHAPRLLSSFAERVKRGIGPFSRRVYLDWALAKDRFQYLPRLRRWQAALGAQNLTVRVGQSDQLAEGDIVADFLREMLGIAHTPRHAARANTSPSAAALKHMQIQGAAFKALGHPRLARTHIPAMRALSDEKGTAARPRWSRVEAERIAAACTADAAALDHAIGGTVFANALTRAVSNAPTRQKPLFDPKTASAVRVQAAEAARIAVENAAETADLTIAPPSPAKLAESENMIRTAR